MKVVKSLIQEKKNNGYTMTMSLNAMGSVTKAAIRQKHHEDLDTYTEEFSLKLPQTPKCEEKPNQKIKITKSKLSDHCTNKSQVGTKLNTPLKTQHSIAYSSTVLYHGQKEEIKDMSLSENTDGGSGNNNWERLNDHQRIQTLLHLYNLPNVSSNLSLKWNYVQ